MLRRLAGRRGEQRPGLVVVVRQDLVERRRRPLGVPTVDPEELPRPGDPPRRQVVRPAPHVRDRLRLLEPLGELQQVTLTLHLLGHVHHCPEKPDDTPSMVAPRVPLRPHETHALRAVPQPQREVVRSPVAHGPRDRLPHPRPRFIVVIRDRLRVPGGRLRFGPIEDPVDLPRPEDLPRPRIERPAPHAGHRLRFLQAPRQRQEFRLAPVPLGRIVRRREDVVAHATGPPLDGPVPPVRRPVPIREPLDDPVRRQVPERRERRLDIVGMHEAHEGLPREPVRVVPEQPAPRLVDPHEAAIEVRDAQQLETGIKEGVHQPVGGSQHRSVRIRMAIGHGQERFSLPSLRRAKRASSRSGARAPPNQDRSRFSAVARHPLKYFSRIGAPARGTGGLPERIWRTSADQGRLCARCGPVSLWYWVG